MSTKHISIWSEWAWDAGRGQWGRYRLSDGEYEYEWQNSEPSIPSTPKPEESTATVWSEWAWDGNRGRWGRYRMSQGEYEYEWQDPEPSSSSTFKADKGKGKGKDSEKSKDDEKSKGGNLSVETYRPRWGNLRHWVLYINSDDWVYEVTGEAMRFTARAKSGIVPSKSDAWKETIFVAKIQPADIGQLHTTITETPVQNNVQGWCCQDYVIEALERLNDEQIVDDKDFEKAKKRLMRRFNN